MTLQLLTLLFTAASVFFLALLVIDVLRRAYEKYRERYLAKKITDLSEMFFFVGPEQLLTLTVAASAVGVAVGLLLFGPLLTVCLGALGFSTPTLLVQFYRKRRIKLFERQLVDALGGLSAAFRAGMTLYQAMEEIGKTSQAPLGQEFSLVVRELRLGTATDEALQNLADRVESEDLALVVASVNTARGTGGNMAEMFDTLASTIRERFRIEGRVRSLTAQGRLQGWVMSAIPILVWLGFDALRPDLTRPMMQHWFGYAVAGLVIGMEILGAFFIRRVIAIRV